MALFVNQTGLDCGPLLWEWSDAQTMYDRRTAYTEAQKIIGKAYAILIIALMLGWLLYSLVMMSMQVGFLSALLFHLSGLFGVIVGSVILLLSAFNAWGRFIRFAFRNGLAKNSAENRSLQAQVLLADILKEEENAVRIHERYIVVINKGKKTVLDMAYMRRIDCIHSGENMSLVFRGKDEFFNAFVDIPVNEFPALKKLLGDLLYVRRESVRSGDDDSGKFGSFNKKIPIILFLLIFVAAGAGVIALHYTLAPDVPILLGAAFIVVPVILFFALFSEHAIIGKGIVPLLLGLFFTAIPIAGAFAIADYSGVSLLSLLPTFTVVHAAFILFLSLGPLIIAAGVKGIVDSVKYRK